MQLIMLQIALRKTRRTRLVWSFPRSNSGLNPFNTEILLKKSWKENFRISTAVDLRLNIIIVQVAGPYLAYFFSHDSYVD